MNENELPPEMSLDGEWDVSVDRRYSNTAPVPGLVGNPGKAGEGTLWYRRAVDLPPGLWTQATLTLNGARFCPSVYLNGNKISESTGGMAPTFHLLRDPGLRPGGKVMLEIALKSMKDMDPHDASRIPKADHWRSNISSCLWDSVRIRFHGETSLTRIIPSSDMRKDNLVLRWEMSSPPSTKMRLSLSLADAKGNEVLRREAPVNGHKGILDLPLEGKCFPWSPQTPHLYRLSVLLEQGTEIEQGGETTDAWIPADRRDIPWGLRDFQVRGLGFQLNGMPVKLRAGSVVWHRWLRDQEAQSLAFDVKWFETNVVLRLKSHGANCLRFHLGNPPEAFLDLCDRHGLMVQAEWIFFHGMEASFESLLDQWRAWLDLCLRHPSVVLLHPWNETEGDALRTAFSALERLSGDYPPMVFSHRDVIHVHKYWWSLFENVGLYYDSASQFPGPIMVDEFGGNYLDGDGEPGGYPSLKESFMRFLGRGHTKAMRLQLQCESYARVAEYWRRIGAAGFSPFCILGSPEDGNHHFLGKLADAEPKPVWKSLTAAYSPLSVSLDIWDRNFSPGQTVEVPVTLFNETSKSVVLSVSVFVTPEKASDRPLSGQLLSCEVPAHGMEKRMAAIQLPLQKGRWRLQALLQNAPPEVTHPVISGWNIRTIAVEPPSALRNLKIGIPDGEPELLDFIQLNGLQDCKLEDSDAGVILIGSGSWRRFTESSELRKILEVAIHKGVSVLMLDIGPVKLGQGYLPGQELGPLQGNMYVKQPEIQEVELLDGVRLAFREMPEPESFLHPSDLDDSLWQNLEKEDTWMWNGLRGGLMVPAFDMEPQGLNLTAFLSQWVNRGGESSLIRGSSYYAFELAGYYAFAKEKDKRVMEVLRSKVKFLVEDAPALEHAINPDAPIKIHDLSSLYRQSQNGRAESLRALAHCGKSLSRTPVIQIDFDRGRGRVILSQLLTKGRLVPGYGEGGDYGVRYDPAAAQFVFNMLGKCIQGR